MARRIMDVNFWGAVYVSREAVRVFRDVNGRDSRNGKKIGGTLLQVSSAWAWDGQPGVAYYTARCVYLLSMSSLVVAPRSI
jgi:NAD(P)-dependent dehydrogenase (short-subunit alcohol dehydrogenase family)